MFSCCYLFNMVIFLLQLTVLIFDFQIKLDFSDFRRRINRSDTVSTLESTPQLSVLLRSLLPKPQIYETSTLLDLWRISCRFPSGSENHKCFSVSSSIDLYWMQTLRETQVKYH